MNKYYLLLSFCCCLLFTTCSKKDNTPDNHMNQQEIEDWPVNLTSILTFTWEDDMNDIILAPGAQPPFIYPYPPVDIDKIKMGVDENYLYIKVEFVGEIPDEVIHIPAQNGVNEQWVKNQGMSVNMNSDGDEQTGAGGEGVKGIDIFFGLGFDYGKWSQAYANYGFPDGDIHHNQGQIEGVIGEGGQGYDYVIIRFDISLLPAQYWPKGTTVDIGSWSEAESFDHDNNVFYHHFAFDPQPSAQFTIPN